MKADEARCPHHLYGSHSVTQSFDAAQYRELALPVISEIAARGKLPIVTGGSGLYIKALTHGLKDAPPADSQLRAELEELSHEEIVKRLQESDPEAAQRIDPKNRRYVQRALEIVEMTGRPSSESRKSWLQDDPRLHGICLSRERSDLTQRIDLRVHQMLADGASEEVQAVERWSETAQKAIGVREILEIAEPDACIEAIQQASRRYAKRQTTWFRRERWLNTVAVHPGSDFADALEQAVQRLP